jgi:hypothetical protein
MFLYIYIYIYIDDDDDDDVYSNTIATYVLQKTIFHTRNGTSQKGISKVDKLNDNIRHILMEKINLNTCTYYSSNLNICNLYN